MMYRPSLTPLAVAAAATATCVGTQVLLLGDMAAVQCCTALYSIVQYCTVLYSIVQYCTVLYSIVQ